MINQIWLIGKGYMAFEYAKVLKDIDTNFLIISRSENCDNRIKELSSPLISGGVKEALKNNAVPDFAIVAVTIENLFEVSLDLINAGCKNILIEKPGSLYRNQLEKISSLAIQKNCVIKIGYNRRFYSSVIELKKLCELEGGIKSINFEFTDISDQLKYSLCR